MARPKSELTEFIMSLPLDLPVKEVVARAAEKGLTTSESNVQRVRGRVRRTAGTAAPSVTKPAAKKTPAKPRTAKKAAAGAPSATQRAARKRPAKPANIKPAPSTATDAGTLSKSDFIRNQPADAPAAAVIAAAKSAGIALSAGLVYEVRAADRRRKSRNKPAPTPETAAPAKATPKARTPKAAKRKAATPPVTRPAAPPVTKPAAPKAAPHSASSAEDLLRAVAAEVGLARSIEILEDLREHVLRVLGG